MEYNIRFGDPEAQALLPLLNGSWLEIFYAVAVGRLPPLKWKNIHSACVVLCSANYPAPDKKEYPIKGSLFHKADHSWFVHGALSCKEGQWFAGGGRVLNAVAVGSSREEALKRAYGHIENISWPGMRYRKDIGLARE